MTFDMAIVQMVCAAAVGVSSVIILEIPKELLPEVIFLSVASWGSYLFCLYSLNLGLVLATYLASLVVAIISHAFARRYKQPVTLFYIPGFFNLVPGGGMYRTAFYFFNSNTTQGFRELGMTLFTAFAIALAVFTMDNMANFLFKSSQHYWLYQPTFRLPPKTRQVLQRLVIKQYRKK